MRCHVAAGDLQDPCLLGEVYSPDTSACPALLQPACRAPFSSGSAPSSCICRQLYLEGGTNTFLPGYEVQLTDRGPEQADGGSVQFVTLRSRLPPGLQLAVLSLTTVVLAVTAES